MRKGISLVIVFYTIVVTITICTNGDNNKDYCKKAPQLIELGADE